MYSCITISTPNNSVNNEKITPLNGIDMPDTWYEWHQEITPEEFEQKMPLKTQLEI